MLSIQFYLNGNNIQRVNSSSDSKEVRFWTLNFLILTQLVRFYDILLILLKCYYLVFELLLQLHLQRFSILTRLNQWFKIVCIRNVRTL